MPIPGSKSGGIERYVRKIRYIFHCHWIGKNRMVLADWNTVNQKIDHPDMDEQKLKQIGTENRLVGFVVAMIVSGIALLVSMGFMFLLIMVALYIVLIFPLFRIMRRV